MSSLVALGCDAVYMACCAAQCAGYLCCSLASCFGCSERSPALAKLIYLFIFLSSAVLAVVLRFYGQVTFSSAWYIPTISVCDSTLQSCFGVQAVYRVSFALAIFFAFMALLTAAFPVTHLGGWLLKLVLYIAFLGVTLLFPNSAMTTYAEAARVFSIFFLLSQVIIIISLVYNVHEYLLARVNALESRLERQGKHSGLLGNCWSNLYVFLSLGLLATSLTGCGLMYRYFGASCPLNNFFISQTLVVGLALCAVSLAFPGTIGKGLLPPVAIMAYNTYLTFSAITNNPDAQCNPSANAANQSQASIIAGLVLAVVSVTWTALSSAGSIYEAVSSSEPSRQPQQMVQQNPASGAKAASGSASARGESRASYQGGNPKRVQEEEEAGEEEGQAAGGRSSRSSGAGATGAGGALAAPAAAPPAPQSRWVPCSFHIELFLAGCYVAMMASNWGEPSSVAGTGSLELSSTSMWVRMGSQFAIHVLFTWTLIAPAVSALLPCLLAAAPGLLISHAHSLSLSHTHTHARPFSA